MQGMATAAYTQVLLGAMTMQMTHYTRSQMKHYTRSPLYIIFLPSQAQY